MMATSSKLDELPPAAVQEPHVLPHLATLQRREKMEPHGTDIIDKKKARLRINEEKILTVQQRAED